jgi:hypothetical protein
MAIPVLSYGLEDKCKAMTVEMHFLCLVAGAPLLDQARSTERMGNFILINQIISNDNNNLNMVKNDCLQRKMLLYKLRKELGKTHNETDQIVMWLEQA